MNRLKPYFERLYTGTKQDFLKITEENLSKESKTFIITANPEAFSFGQTDSLMNEMLLDKSVTVVPDGIGIVKAAKMLSLPVTERIPGVEIAENLFVLANKMSKKVFLFGSKPEVLKVLTEKIKSDYPNIVLCGAVDGYVSDKNSVFDKIEETKPDIILVALGIPLQEKLIYSNISRFSKGIFVGVGGSFDVLSGTKKRAPEFIIKLNLEWLYRILKEPKRLKRFYNNNVKFIFKIKKEARRNKNNEN